jgi:hypothetical protein
MISKIIGRAQTTALMKKMRGGPQSMLPMSPGKGSGVKSLKGLTPKKMRKFVAKKQNPAFTPNTGGLARLSRTR